MKDTEDVKTFLDKEKQRIRAVELLKHVQTQSAKNRKAYLEVDEIIVSDDECDEGLKRPRALDL